MNQRTLFVLLLFPIAIFAVFFLLQNRSVYTHTLGHFADTWVHENGNPVLRPQPYQKLTNDNYIQWDGVHYKWIAQDGYKVKEAGGDFIFAFFPLFPFVWHISGLPPLGIIPLNFLFFAIGILILLSLFRQDNLQSSTTSLLLALSLPTAVVFFLPYTEALFLLVAAIGLYGLIRNKYWLYFLGFFLCALTRPTYTFLTLSIIGTELFFLCYYRNLKKSLKSMFYKLLPLLLGTLAVSVIQSAWHGGGFFKFIEVQKYWDHHFSIPKQITDWSHEGFAISSGLLALIFLPLVAILLWLLIRQIKTFRKSDNSPAQLPITQRNYVLLLSLIYLSGTFLFILFFQGGSFNGLSRYVLCSPFFLVILFYAPKFFQRTNLRLRVGLFLLLATAAIFFINQIEYSQLWNFSDFGLFILIAVAFLWLFQQYASRRLYHILLYLTLFSNVVWTSWLFNTYIASGWTFT